MSINNLDSLRIAHNTLRGVLKELQQNREKEIERIEWAYGELQASLRIAIAELEKRVEQEPANDL